MSLPATSLRTERRRDERRSGSRLPLLIPDEATILDCSARGLGIETMAYLSVGGLTKVDLPLPGGKLEFLARVCWAKLVENRGLGDGQSERVFRAGLCLVGGQSLHRWNQLWARLISPGDAEVPSGRPRRRIIRWRSRPSSR